MNRDKMVNGAHVIVKSVTYASFPVPNMKKYKGETGVIANDRCIIFDNPGVQQVQEEEAPTFWSWGAEDLELVE